MGYLSYGADQRLAAFGLTGLTLATVLVTPQFFPLSRRSPVIKWSLEKTSWHKSGPYLGTIAVAAALAVTGFVLALVGGASLDTDDGVLAFTLGIGMMALVAGLGYVLSVAERVNAGRADDEVPAEKVSRDMRRRSIVSMTAAVAFLAGTVLQFVEVYEPDNQRCRVTLPEHSIVVLIPNDKPCP